MFVQQSRGVRRAVERLEQERVLQRLLNVGLDTRLVFTHLMAVTAHAAYIELRSRDKCRSDDYDNHSQPPIHQRQKYKRANELHYRSDKGWELLG